ncbi:MAG TPA: hypothetical protein VIZ28_18985 [Chitinophagaceae bacterium]
MQKILVAAFAVALFSCNNEEKKEGDTVAAAPATAELSSSAPYKATYSSKFEMGDIKHAETILALWKDWDNGNLTPSANVFADSIFIYTRDGSRIEGLKDSVNAGAQAYRDMFASVTSTVHAIFPIKSTDKDENWVCIWGTEVSTDKKGKTDSVVLHETWRFTKDGKVDMVLQYGRALLPRPATK